MTLLKSIVEHDASDVEQQHVDRAGSERSLGHGEVHGSRFTKLDPSGQRRVASRAPSRNPALKPARGCAKRWECFWERSHDNLEPILPPGSRPGRLDRVGGSRHGSAGVGAAAAEYANMASRIRKRRQPKKPPKRKPRRPTSGRSAIFRRKRPPIPGESRVRHRSSQGRGQARHQDRFAEAQGQRTTR